MEKITLKKQIYYYYKEDLQDIQEIYKKTFDNLDDALLILKSSKINYIENKKGISAVESFIILHQKDKDTFEKYTKTIDPTTKEEITTAPSKKEETPEKEILTLGEVLKDEI